MKEWDAGGLLWAATRGGTAGPQVASSQALRKARQPLRRPRAGPWFSHRYVISCGAIHASSTVKL